MTRHHRIIGLLIALTILALAGCAGSSTSRSTGTYLDDKTISTKVKAQLAADSLTQAIQVEVETYGGVVQLSGFVESMEKKQRAEEIASGVSGVKRVVNNLVLRGG
jgi:osmotically-inducible protein OsmY